MKHNQSVLHNKGLLFQEKTFLEPYLMWKRLFPTPSPSSLVVSPKAGWEVREQNIVKKESVEHSHEIYFFKEIARECYSQGSRKVNTGGGAIPLNILVKVSVQRCGSTKRLRFNQKLIEHSPLPYLITILSRLQYNYSGQQLKEQ